MIPPSTEERNFYLSSIKQIIKNAPYMVTVTAYVTMFAKNKLHAAFIDEQVARLMPDYLKGKVEISAVIVAPDAEAFSRICNYGG